MRRLIALALLLAACEHSPPAPPDGMARLAPVQIRCSMVCA